MTSFTNLPNIPDILFNTSWADEVEEAEATTAVKTVAEPKPRRQDSKASPVRGQRRSPRDSPRDSPRNSPKLSPGVARGPSPKPMEGSGLTTSRWARPDDSGPTTPELSPATSLKADSVARQASPPADPLPKPLPKTLPANADKPGYLSTCQLEWVDCPASISPRDLLTYFNTFTGDKRLSVALSDTDSFILTFKTPECGKPLALPR